MRPIEKFLGIALLLFALPASAVTLTEWGTVAATGSADCAEPCDQLSFLSAFAIHDVDGGIGQLSAASVLTPGMRDLGHAQAAVTVVGGLQIPELKAEAYSTAAGGTVALALGAQAYHYLGGSGTVTVQVDLTGSIQNTGDSLNTGLAVAVALFRADSIFALFEPVDGTLPAEALLALLTYGPAATVELERHSSNPALADVGHELSISGLSAGDEFYLFAAIIASADGADRFADAFSTVALSFSAGGDELALAAVPLPGGVWRLVSGLGGLFLLRRHTL